MNGALRAITIENLVVGALVLATAISALPILSHLLQGGAGPLG